ncbi:MAG: helix-turn-helix domain-containing protein [Thiohalospira sp.]
MSGGKRETEEGDQAGSEIPIPASEIGSRISEAAETVGGKKKLAAATGISESHIYRYISGASEPTASRLVRIAQATGFSVAWLATGEGEPHAGSGVDNGSGGEPAYARRSETSMDRADEIREIKPTPVKVREDREPENRTAQLSEEPDDGAAVPFITALSVAISGPARRHSEGALDEKDKRLWVTMKAYSTLWNLYQQREDVLNRLTEEDVDPVVQGVAHAYDLLHWPKGEAGDDWFY